MINNLTAVAKDGFALGLPLVKWRGYTFTVGITGVALFAPSVGGSCSELAEEISGRTRWQFSITDANMAKMFYAGARATFSATGYPDVDAEVVAINTSTNTIDFFLPTTSASDLFGTNCTSVRPRFYAQTLFVTVATDSPTAGTFGQSVTFKDLVPLGIGETFAINAPSGMLFEVGDLVAGGASGTKFRILYC